MSKNRTNNYIFGPQSSTNLKARGGTEKIVSLLCKQRGFKLVIEREYLKNINDSHILLTGVNLISKIFLIPALLLSRNSVTLLKSATYTSRARRFLELLTSTVLSVHPLISYRYISETQKPIYPLGRKLNVLELLIADAPVTDTDCNRKYACGYVGRIDVEKGFYDAYRHLGDLHAAGKHVKMDLLVWNDADTQFAKSLKKQDGMDVIYGGKTEKSEPAYHEYKQLYLPYKSLGSTIALPLVPLEAAIAGCDVMLPGWLKRILDIEAPLLSDKFIEIEVNDA